ncbi:c-x8-c-x5-c-x3-h type zinc finger protein [Neofusicoccum parvum]|uniref:C-x8-c-x5-c-x3-h type zinc finger protein n=1 Tax=Neofusicoccum parvum TaxID=310453 RepID=A0ACB5SFG6_9PEZI|nr:c-x8-c-x5-c-x3-h type zinc finger protein [Neofusicoccum parvum]
MASNHVHLDEHPAGQQSNMFARPELNAFDNLFSNAHPDQPFDAAAWNFEQQGTPPQWQQQAQQQPMPAAFDSANAFYARDFSNSPAPYANQSFAHHGQVPQQFQQTNLDPALMSAATAEHSNFTTTASNSNMRAYATSAASTITPQALQSRQSPYGGATPPVSDFQTQQTQQRQNSAVQQQAPASTPPAATTPTYVPAPPAKYPDAPTGKAVGKFYVVEPNELAKVTNSLRLHEFVHIGNDAIEMPIMKSSLPQYQPRKSRNELRKLAANDERLRALKDFWDIIQAVRNRWKEDQQALKLAQEKNSRDIELLKGRVKDQRVLMEMAMKCALEHGHPDVIRVLGGNAPLLFLAYQFLADRIRENEYNDSFSKTIIELLSRSENITVENMERTKLNTALKRYLNRGDERTKPQAKQILDRAEANSKKSLSSGTNGAAEKKTEVKKDSDASKEIKTESGSRPQPPAVAGVKRPRPGDGSAAQPIKRITSATAPSTTAAASTKTAASGLKRPGVTSTTSSANGAASAATKPKMVAKPNMFAGLQSASKRSSAAVQKPAVGAATAPKKPAAPASSAPKFSFAETMANLTKPKEQQPAAKPEENRPPETEEEKTKRLRKEARRKLRVKWADDSTGNKTLLESVRLFTHDPDEEIGHDASMVRDVGDVGGEGRMFKQHKDMMDLDDDDDRLSEEDFRKWKMPSMVDFSRVDDQERNRNYEPYGGGVMQVESPEKAVQEQHEASTLLVFYTSPGDIPPCPREPPEEEQQPQPDAKPPVELGEPPETSPYTARAAHFAPPAPPADTPVPDISRIMSILSQAQQQAPPQPAQPPQPAAASNDLEKTFSMFMPQQPPQISQPPAQALAPAAPAAADIQAILASLGNLTGQPQQPQPQQPPPQQPPASFPNMNLNPGNGSGFDLAAILQSVGNGAAPPAVPAFGMPLPNQQQQQQHAHQPLPSQEELFHGERGKRQRGDNDHSGSGGGGAGGGGWNNKRRKWKNKNQQNPDYQPPQFVVPCKFWKEGKCMKGDKCPVHSSSHPPTTNTTTTTTTPPMTPTAPSSSSLPHRSKKKKKKNRKNKTKNRDSGGDIGEIDYA